MINMRVPVMPKANFSIGNLLSICQTADYLGVQQDCVPLSEADLNR